MEKKFIVGAMYHPPRNQNAIINCTDFISVLENGKVDVDSEYYLGQGFEYEPADELCKRIKNIEPNIKLFMPSYLKNKEECLIVHKQHRNNVLITKPEEGSEDRYVNYLCLGDSNLIKDHTTGLHVQGMVVIEAARQTPISIIERYIYQGEDSKNYSMLWGKLTANFYQYLLPLEICIETTITRKTYQNEKHTVEFILEFKQSNKVAAKFEITAVCLPKLITRSLEDKNLRSLNEFSETNHSYVRV